MSMHDFGSPFLICDEEGDYYQRQQEADEEKEYNEEENERNYAQHNNTSTPEMGKAGDVENTGGRMTTAKMSKDTEENIQEKHEEKPEAQIVKQEEINQAEESEQIEVKEDREMLCLSRRIEGKMSGETDIEEKGRIGSEGEERANADMTLGGVLSVCEQSLEQSVLSAGLAFRHVAQPLQPPDAQPEALALGKPQTGILNSQTLEVSTLLPPMEVQLTQVYTTRQYTRFTGHGHPVLPLTTQAHAPPADHTALPPVPKKKTRTLYSADQLQELERLFQDDHYPDGDRRREIAASVGVTPQRIMVWFQNRRAKWRKTGKGPLKTHKTTQRTSYFSGTVPSVLPQPPTHTQTLPPYSSLIGSLSSPAACVGQVYVSQEGGPPPMHSPPPLRRASLSLSLDPNQHIVNLPTVDTWSNYTDLSSLKMDPQHHVVFVPMSNTMHYPSKTHTHTQPMQHTNTLNQQYLSNLPYINPTYMNSGPTHAGHTHTPTHMTYSLPTTNSLVPACCQQNNQMHQVPSRLCSSEPPPPQPGAFQGPGRLSLHLQPQSHYSTSPLPHTHTHAHTHTNTLFPLHTPLTKDSNPLSSVTMGTQPGPSQTLSSRRESDAHPHSDMHTHPDLQIHTHSDMPFHCDFSPLIL
ncbi:uncharacterized protein LOC121695276 isoform X1 [Alosa sapidissima]|uniref:uncharacterized protein LOC121695276 isoform X1 n=2 Tax=Alosa sapidissima TaxID=34773 RepID=UPI001C0A5EBC|nr:uncharacterized protein LOC121695276 isoform X1 [Alosa sapidissima]